MASGRQYIYFSGFGKRADMGEGGCLKRHANIASDYHSNYRCHTRLPTSSCSATWPQEMQFHHLIAFHMRGARGFGAQVHVHQTLFPLCRRYEIMGHCKSWTRDSGLDCGLDYGLKWTTVTTTSKLSVCSTQIITSW